MSVNETTLDGVAIIGLAGRFPGARSVDEFWANLVGGRESIDFFSDEALRRAGYDPDALRRAGHFVPARGVIEGADTFDAAFFGIHPKEAEVMDPQHRVFLETCWEALEQAGYAPDRVPGSVALYAGATFNTYYLHELHPRPALRATVGEDQISLGNEKDYLATRVAYKLNLRGPAIAMSTACSSSLVAVSHACQSLLTYQSDLALAGGVSVVTPQTRGYFHQEGNIGSPDGHTRTFDARAAGTVFSNGAAVVVLKRLADAVADGDTIYAVIKGTALNNDGAGRASFGAPGVDGQVEAISLAQELAGVSPDSVTYVEAHGTATPIGDPIEVAALTKAFRRGTNRRQFCALGSVKTNIGHLDAAAGTAGLIKTALSLHHHVLPPSLNFETPNPRLDIEHSPFFVNTTLRPWTTDDGVPRRAGVSSFGTGGTNAHVVLEEAPPAEPTSPSRPVQLLVLSAKSADALEAATRRLGAHLEAHPDVDLADTAFTLKVGRTPFAYRRAIACRDVADAVAQIGQRDPRQVATEKLRVTNPPVVFMFPGQGAQHVNMGAGLYRRERVFREHLDACAAALQPHLGVDLRDVMFSAAADPAAEARLRDTRFTQPALFSIEYSLARLWMSWGIEPAAMIGHSVGEYVAACLAGVLTLDDALVLVARRAALVQAQPTGAMLAVRLPEADVRPMLGAGLSLAAINAPNLSVVSGPHDAIAALTETLGAAGINAKALHTSHAFHSSMMDDVVEPFEAVVKGIKLAAPTIPYISNVTGTWATANEATDPHYWATHLRDAVQFSKGLAELATDPDRVFLEVGPGQTLTQLARQQPAVGTERIVTNSLGGRTGDDEMAVAMALGRLWVAGVAPDWSAYYGDERRRRVALPTYPFERKRHWPEGEIATPVAATAATTTTASSAPAAGETATTTPPSATAPAAQPMPAVDAAPRRERLEQMLRETLQELSGLDLSGAGASVEFLELGLDSLILTQAATLVHRKFGVEIAFRQLFEELGTIGTLAAYLDQHLPEGAFAPAPAVVPTASAAMPSTASVPAGALTPVTGGVEQLLQQQARITEQLLALIRGGSAPAQPATSTPAASATHTPAAAAMRTPDTAAHGPFRPPDRSTGADLSPRQQQWLATVIARYTARTGKSKRLADQNRPGLADPRSAAGFKPIWKEMVYPLYTERSEGARVWDVDGHEYVDFTMGFGAQLFGHRPPFLVQALKDQLDRGFEIGPIQPIVGDVARMVTEMTGMQRVAFCNTGSEAVQAAIRVSRTVTGRDTIVMFAGSYHGMFDEVLARPAGAKTLPIAPGIPTSGVSQVVVLDYGSPAALDYLKQHGNEIAAVLVEPVQSRRPDLQPREFLHELRDITARTGTALIFDEVVTGFRAAPGGAQEYFGIRADLATYGKVIGAGFPIGVVAGDPRFIDALDGGRWQFGDASFPGVGVTFFAGTFVRHPLAMAAAKSVLEHLKREGPALQASIHAKAAAATARVAELFTRYGAPYTVGQFSGLMFVSVPPTAKYGGLLFYLLRERGIHIWENRGFIFTTAHTDADIDALVAAFDASLRELTEGDFLGGTTPTEGRATTSTSAVATATPAISTASTAVTATAERRTSFPLTAAQREMWLASLQAPAAARSYDIALALRLDGPLERAALTTALQALVDRHDSLRATIDLHEPIQRVTTSRHFELPFTDLEPIGEPATPAALERLRTAFGNAHPPLSSPSLFRAELVRLSSTAHVLFLGFNHLVVDGWSSGVILHELQELYAAARGGRAATLEPALQFADYAASLDGQAYRELQARAGTFWRQRFAQVPEPLDLPEDKARGADRTFAAERVTVRWPEPVALAMRKAAARQGGTLLHFLLTGFFSLLHRLSGQDDLVVGVPSAGQLSRHLQTLPGARSMVGHAVSLLPIRGRVSGTQPFGALMKDVKRTLLDAFDHPALSFGELVQTLKLTRDPARVPLVPITFNVDRVSGALDLEGVRVGVDELSRATLVFDASVNVVDDDRELVVHWDFNAEVWERETIERWVGLFRTLLERAIDTPDAPIGHLPILSDSDRAIVGAANATAVVYPREATVASVFESVAKAWPSRVALRCGHDSLTYADLDLQSTRVAHALIAQGVGPDVLVGVAIDRSIDLVVAVLGVLKAGGAYMPLDASYPAARLAFMAADSRVRAVLTSGTSVSGLPAGLTVLDVSRLRASGPTTPIEPRAGATDLAYVMYTSGSTGQPKGVAIPHRGIVRLVCGSTFVDWADVRVILHMAPIAFDASTFELWGGLLHGATVALLPDRHVTLEGLAEALRSNSVDCLWLTAAFFNVVVDSQPEMLRGVRQLLVGGEALSVPHVRRALAALPTTQLINGYGPTESTTFACCYRIPRTLDASVTRVPIGGPISNTTAAVIDTAGHAVPVGVPGELWLGGDGLARGYLNQPALTAERFVTNTAGRWYRTGDRVRWRADGALEFLGRLDRQVKLRGFRIELGEIETVLCQAPGVRQAAVIVREDRADDARLVAYVVGAGGLPPTPAALRAHADANLPAYMVPAAFVVLDRLPENANGKVDRDALPAPVAEVVSMPRVAAAPRTATETRLIELWQQTLGVAHVTGTESFFELGGHSLLAIKLCARIKDELGVELPFSALMRFPTVVSMAKEIERLQRLADERPAHTALTALREGGSRPPVFFAHGVGGEVWSFGALTRHLGDDQPVFGLLPIDGHQSSVPEMAARYIEEIQSVTPDGPFMLAGYCSGAALALEMGRQLRAQGAPVGLVAVLDYALDETSERSRVQRVFDFLRNLPLWVLDDLTQVGWPTLKGRFASKLRLLRTHLARLKGERAAADIRDELGVWRFPEYQAAALADANRVFKDYVPQAYEGSVLLIKPRAQPLFSNKLTDDMGWREVSGALSIREVKGSHETMLSEPFVADVAQTLREAVDRVIADREALTTAVGTATDARAKDQR